jgi:hypothetical protein
LDGNKDWVLDKGASFGYLTIPNMPFRLGINSQTEIKKRAEAR